jgi:hypothetical protein
MDRFIAIHEVKPNTTQDEAWEAAHAIATSATGGARWLRSYLVPEMDEMICDWEAPDEAAIRQSLKPYESTVPIKAIHRAVYMDPGLFK